MVPIAAAAEPTPPLNEAINPNDFKPRDKKGTPADLEPHVLRLARSLEVPRN